MITLDDTAGNLSVTIEHANHSKVSMTQEGNVAVTSPLGSIDVTAQAGSISLNAPAGNICLKAPEGSINLQAQTVGVTGKITATDDISTTGNITAGLIGLSTHLHSGVQTGPGMSGGPVPPPPTSGS